MLLLTEKNEEPTREREKRKQWKRVFLLNRTPNPIKLIPKWRKSINIMKIFSYYLLIVFSHIICFLDTHLLSWAIFFVFISFREKVLLCICIMCVLEWDVLCIQWVRENLWIFERETKRTESHRKKCEMLWICGNFFFHKPYNVAFKRFIFVILIFSMQQRWRDKKTEFLSNVKVSVRCKVVCMSKKLYILLWQ